MHSSFGGWHLSVVGFRPVSNAHLFYTVSGVELHNLHSDGIATSYRPRCALHPILIRERWDPGVGGVSCPKTK